MKFNKIIISLIILFLILGFSGYAAAKDVRFSSESGEPGETVTVSINVDNLSGIAGYNIEISYDPKVLTAIYASVGAGAPSGLFVGNVLDPNGPGTVSLTLAGVTAITGTGPGELATINFDILANANKNSPLTFNSISLKNEAGVDLAGTTSSNGTLAVNITVTPPVIDHKPEGYVDNIPSTYPLLKFGMNTTLTAADSNSDYNWTVTDWNGTVVDSQTGALSYVLDPDNLFALSGAGIYTVTLEDPVYGGLASSTLRVRVPLKITSARFGGSSGVYNDNQGTDTYTITGGPPVNAYHYAALNLEGAAVTQTDCGRFQTSSPTDTDNVFLFTNGIPDMIAYRVMVTLDNGSSNADIQRLINSDLDEVWSGIFRVVPLLTYYGTVVETDGATPVPGVTVTAIHDATRTDITDANGDFSIADLQDNGVTYRFKLTKGGYIEKSVTGAQIVAGPIELEVLGAGSGTISGSVSLSGSETLPDDVAIKAKDAGGNDITDNQGNVISVYTTGGDYTFPIPTSFANRGPFTLEFRKTGYIYMAETPLGRLTNVALNSTGADITLQPVSHIMVTGTTEDTSSDGTYDQVLVKITAKAGPEAVLYDDFTGMSTEISVMDLDGNGIPLYAFTRDGAASWSFTHEAYENFTIMVDADVTDDHDVDNDYTATKVWSYVKTATAPAITIITDPCTNGGTASSTSGDTTVNLPPGGITGDILNRVVISIVESNTGVEIALLDDNGDEIGNDRIGRIEITMKFDPTLIPTGAIEDGTYAIYQADSLEDMANGVYSQVSLDQIILPIDYTNGYLTFWVNHLSAFVIGAGDSSGSDGGGCFINTSLPKQNTKGSITFTLIMVLLSILTSASSLVRNRKKV